MTDYADSLQLLKAQHLVLSAKREQLALAAQRQCDCAADLLARTDFLHQTLESAQSPAQTDLACSLAQELPLAGGPRDGRGALFSHQTSVGNQEIPLAAARHWYAVAQQMTKELQSLRRLVHIDALTGLYNRRSFENRLLREVAIAQRSGAPFCLLMIDIDHFKKVNDSYGHPTGDLVLRSVAASLESCTRPSDQVARYGGEEFAVILTATQLNRAAVVAERIRSQIQRTLHGSLQVTVSIGVAEYHPHRSQSLAQLLAEADRALYLAKHCGRNRVHLAGVQFFGADPIASSNDDSPCDCPTLPIPADSYSRASA